MKTQLWFNFAIILVISSCSSITSKSVTPDSFALGVLKAAKMNDDLKDTEVSRELYEKIMHDDNFDFALSPTAYPRMIENTSCATITDPTIACWYISSHLPSSRNRFFAWIPARNINNPPEQYMHDILTKAFEETAVSLYADAKVTADKDSLNKFSLMTNITDDCNQACTIDFNLKKKPTAIKSPAFLHQSSQSIFIETAKQTNNNSGILFTRVNMNASTYFIELSKRLPSWAFIYLAPNMIAGLKVPLVLNQGNIHYLIKQKQ